MKQLTRHCPYDDMRLFLHPASFLFLELKQYSTKKRVSNKNSSDSVPKRRVGTNACDALDHGGELAEETYPAWVRGREGGGTTAQVASAWGRVFHMRTSEGMKSSGRAKSRSHT